MMRTGKEQRDGGPPLSHGKNACRKNASPVRRILQQRLPAFGLSHEFQHAHLGVVVMHQLALRRQPQQMVVGLSRTPLRGVALSAITIIEGLLIRIIEGRMVA
jgi:hypothetical protein